eukprot:tig00001110_g7076.t1
MTPKTLDHAWDPAGKAGRTSVESSDHLIDKSSKHSVGWESLQLRSHFREAAIKMRAALERQKVGLNADSTEYGDNDSHQVRLEVLEERFNTQSERGLTEIRAHEELAKRGKNAISLPRRFFGLLPYLKGLFSGYCGLYWICACFSFVLYGLDSDKEALGIAIGLLVLIAVCDVTLNIRPIGGSLYSNIIPQWAQVVREGARSRVHAAELVPGDLILLEAGDRIPADCRIVDCTDFKVDMALFTGIGTPQGRCKECTDDSPLESKNVALAGTLAVQGSARALVTATGNDTIAARMIHMALDRPQARSSNSDMARFQRIAGIFALA